MFGKTLTKKDIQALNNACDHLRAGCVGGCLQVGWCKACFDYCRGQGASSGSIRGKISPYEKGARENDT